MFRLSTYVRQIPEPPRPHDNQEEEEVTRGWDTAQLPALTKG